MNNFPHWIDHIVAFIFCAAIPFYAGWKKRKGFTITYFSSAEKKNIYVSGSFSLFLMAAVVITVWLIFRRAVSELGLTQPVNINQWWWVLLIFIVVYVGDIIITLFNKKGIEEAKDNWKKRTPFLPTRKNELPEYVLLCFSAGVFEEIVYRGYLITYCIYLFEQSAFQNYLAIFFPALVFSIAHFYQGFKAVIKIFVLSVFFGYLFLLSGSLLIVMILHFLVDLAGGLLTMKYLKTGPIEFPDPDENSVND